MAIITYPHPDHRNGSGSESIQKQHRAVLDALHVAIGAVIEASPHGRDWQDSHPAAYQAARQASRARIGLLEDMRAEVENGLMLVIS